VAKVQGPLISSGAHGSFGSSFYFRKAKSGTVACNIVAPSNPQTTAQQANRGYFSTIAPRWRDIKAYDTDVAAWERRRRYYRKNPSPYHEFISSYKNLMLVGLPDYYCFIKHVVMSSLRLEVREQPDPNLYNLKFSLGFDDFSPVAATNFSKFYIGTDYPNYIHMFDFGTVQPANAWHARSFSINRTWDVNYLKLWFYPDDLAEDGVVVAGIYEEKDIPIV
jgi:hypothetical protein